MLTASQNDGTILLVLYECHSLWAFSKGFWRLLVEFCGRAVGMPEVHLVQYMMCYVSLPGTV